MDGVVRSQLQRMAIYDDPVLLEKARSVIPVARLQDRARAATATAPAEFSDTLLKELLAWFKGEFFTWVDTVRCAECNGKTEGVGAMQPTADEQRFGAGRVEAHKCTMCGAVNRFPRFNDPGKLLETRRGRCGEWANCFVLCARALHFDVRYIYDFTDHVWAEVWSAAANRWLHCDPCENACDTPHLYEGGWGKKLTYIFAFERDEVVDVTWRYTKDVAGVLARRTECSETALVGLLAAANAHAKRGQTARRARCSTNRMIGELAGFAAAAVPGSVAAAAARPAVGGRITGSLEWRAQRGELGPGGAAADR